MKKARILAGAILASGLWTGAALAQPGAGAGAGAAAGGAAPAAGADGAAAAAKPGFCEKVENCIDRKRRKLCQSPFGQMLNAITKPFTAFSGGIIPGFFPGTPRH